LQAADLRYDLVLAADVFIYVGDLESVFAGVRRVLDPGGVFCFSAELAGSDGDFELKLTLRYGQSERYLRALAQRHAFAVERVLRQPIREDRQQPVAGLYVYLTAT
ncbi:MAG: methyltransferase domain-containing protein, partial [Burkholderiales bacterium]|nr:methyltransferase domain-containing protein [Burkholderiales bacterium]